MMAPKDGSNASRSPYREEIYQCLRSRWSAVRVRRHLIRQYVPEVRWGAGERTLWEEYRVPSLQSIQRYTKRWLPSTDIVPDITLDKRLAEIDVQIDVVHELAELLWCLKGRIAQALKAEGIMPFPLAITDQVVRTYRDTLAAYLRHSFELGVLRETPPLVRASIEATFTAGRPKEDEKNMTDEELNHRIEKLLAQLDQIEEGGALPSQARTVKKAGAE